MAKEQHHDPLTWCPGYAIMTGSDGHEPYPMTVTTSERLSFKNSIASDWRQPSKYWLQNKLPMQKSKAEMKAELEAAFVNTAKEQANA